MNRFDGRSRTLARLAIAREFLDEYASLDKGVRRAVQAAFGKFGESGRPGLNLEKVAGAQDDRIRTIRINKDLRGIVLAPDSGDTYCLIAVLPHDDAYRFATSRVFSVNQALGVLDVRDEEEIHQLEPRLQAVAEARSARLFADVSDSDLARLGVDADVAGLARLITSEDDLDLLERRIPDAQYAALLALACGSTVEEAWAEIAGYYAAAPALAGPDTGDVVAAMERTVGQIAFVASRDELQEVLANPGAGWRIFLHPSRAEVLPESPTVAVVEAAGDVVEFRDRDHDYLDWTEAHPAGFVLNVGRSGRGASILHRANCATITGKPPLTGPYMKVCSNSAGDLDGWSLRRTGSPGRRCGICGPSQQAVPTAARPGAELAQPATASRATGAVDVPRWRVEGPSPGLREVWLWADEYIPFEGLSEDQRTARTELRQRVQSLVAQPGEILDASYAGSKPGNADVENLVLYNVGSGCFRASARYGVRFEMATGPRGEGRSAESGCSYRYRLIDPGAELAFWQPERAVARFADADLGRFRDSHRLMQTWFAVRNDQDVEHERTIAAETPFGLVLELKFPRARPVTAHPELVKAVMDGTVAAFQAHGDRATLAEIARRLATDTGGTPDEVAQMLADDRRAVLGVPYQLVFLRGGGVQWNPGDHMCMAGQLTYVPADKETWALSGEIWALKPRPFESAGTISARSVARRGCGPSSSRPRSC